jgi:hypothetical protein
LKIRGAGIRGCDWGYTGRMENLRINIDAQRSVSALLLKPVDPAACFVFTHGAGAGMNHPFMDNVARALFDRRLATLRYQFPSMEARAKRPDPPAVAQTAVRAAVGAASQHCPNVMLIAGGKSFGGRMDLAGSGRIAFTECHWARVLRLSASRGRQTVHRKGGTPV